MTKPKEAENSEQYTEEKKEKLKLICREYQKKLKSVKKQKIIRK
jgi:hypothetical protein